MERYLDLWPVVVVALMAFFFIRAGRRSTRHDVKSGGDYADVTTRHSARRDSDFGSGGGGDGGD